MSRTRTPPAFTPADRRAWNRLGDAMLPGYPSAGLPAFSESGAVELLPRLLAASPPDDVAALRVVVRMLACLPRPLIRAVLRLLRWGSVGGGPFPGGLCRLLELGLRGPLLSCYYAGLDRAADGTSMIHSAIGYQVSCEPLCDKSLSSDSERTSANEHDY